MAGGNKHPSPSQSSRPPPVFSGDIKSFSKISLDAARAIVRATPMPSADGIHFCSSAVSIQYAFICESHCHKGVHEAGRTQTPCNKPVQRQTSAINKARKLLRTVNANTSAHAAAVCPTIPYDIQVCVSELQARNAKSLWTHAGDRRTRAVLPQV